MERKLLFLALICSLVLSIGIKKTSAEVFLIPIERTKEQINAKNNNFLSITCSLN